MKPASMGYPAAVANGLDFAMDPLRVAERVLVIDGCSENCARPAMEKVGASSFDHILLSDLGMEKAHTRVDQEHIAHAYERAEMILADGK